MMRRSFLALLGLFLLCLTALPVSAQATPEAGAPRYAPEGVARLIAVSPDGSMAVGTTSLDNDSLCTYAVPAGTVIACVDLAAQHIRIDFQDVSWSPDSLKIAFAETTWFTYKDGDLWSMDARTGSLSNLTDDGYAGKLSFGSSVDFAGPIYADVLPRWSPDGSQIAFSRTAFLPDGGTPSELWLLDVASGESRMVARVSDHELALIYWGIAWSPDGKTIYATLAHRDAADPGNDVWSFDVASGTSTHIAQASADFKGTYPAMIDASPDGKWLSLFYQQFLTQETMPRQTGYGLLSLESGQVTPIEPPADIAGALPAPVYLPGFTPDGQSLLYAVRRYGDGMGLVQMRNLATDEEQTIATTSGGAFPTPISHGTGMTISSEGIAFVPLSLTDGLLITLP